VVLAKLVSHLLQFTNLGMKTMFKTFKRFAPFNRRATRLRSKRFERVERVERFERLERERSDWRNVTPEPQRVVVKKITTEKC
jgi:N-glycosylase/DNA lyase